MPVDYAPRTPESVDYAPGTPESVACASGIGVDAAWSPPVGAGSVTAGPPSAPGLLAGTDVSVVSEAVSPSAPGSAPVGDGEDDDDNGSVVSLVD